LKKAGLECFDERAAADQEIVMKGVKWYSREDKVLEDAEVVLRCVVRYDA
jgi:3-hydroxyisobutyrate dehydrogenase-like beta-hydroxyacid dehydrogenase